MADNTSTSTTSPRTATYILLACAIASQIFEYVQDSSLPERFSSIYLFAACCYCVHASPEPTYNPNFEVFVILCMGVSSQIMCLRSGSSWLTHINHLLATLALYIGAAKPFRRRAATTRELR
ncbi:hypothetical protein CLAFUW4_14202 [Fulvia fulva]|uniref:Uncharacterized protein n=1 Tax=Passalora fulva TaxID=5499 RepID=A0A9Q8PLC4_PASFU|nr:uncharacterized protein CLAFUR5_14035 [Fulvia fulva]KAK4610108.1 hypothetical protein CLAFUR4_14205 [Fulvia fulva]KAK4610839.1 hypothetical protein CLAFUR0_14210 [Fulvia fulva]UJO24734.1 hypothetical protein CLAFUR5_14035 [Fulvia fulva]WPV21729.1 hypothetical protein CLAFUW4_14202 [Fulvia fulva]WPV36964.1 hypothetical protein CLAFUW7_14213 [Fulvia fulva]